MFTTVLFTSSAQFIALVLFIIKKKLFFLEWLCFSFRSKHIGSSLSVFLGYLFFCKTSVNMSKGEWIQPFTQDEIKKVRFFLKELDKLTCTSLTHTGTSLSPLLLDMSQFYVGFNASDKPSNQYCILDSGATNHMTPLPTHFSTYSPCHSNKKISTVDGSLIIVASQGNVQISPTIMLQNVLHIPKLSTGLISIQKLAKDLSFIGPPAIRFLLLGHPPFMFTNQAQ